jgi:rhodanese-related sulfurtransferase
MIGALRRLFGLGPKTSFTELMQQGALVVDVRTPDEFNTGHIKGAINLPLDRIQSGNHKLRDKQKPYILCCRSGMRSAAAASALRNQGYAKVVNGGGWHALKKKLNQPA